MNLIDNRAQTIQRAENFIQNLNEEVFLFGRNKYGVSIIKWLKSLNKNVVGFIDDFTDLTSFENLKIYKSDNDFTKSAIINCVVEGRSVDVENLILSLSPKITIDYFALQYTFSDLLIHVDFLNGTDSILENLDEYKSVFSILEDKQSKEEYMSLINFRLNRNLSFMKGFKMRLNQQYFENFINLLKAPTFVDGGGFDASTSLEFIRLYPDYKDVYYFEPNSKSMEKSKINFFEKKGIHFFQKGLWSSKTVFHFDSSLGSASILSDCGKDSIETISIDEAISDNIDFIKLDIEGAEIEALIGAQKTIKAHTPNLAICVYHKQADFINIPKLILKFNPKYKVYLRHYSQGVFESVMYFLN
jgi:FkbM family methyltransferase